MVDKANEQTGCTTITQTIQKLPVVCGNIALKTSKITIQLTVFKSSVFIAQYSTVGKHKSTTVNLNSIYRIYSVELAHIRCH